MGVPLKKRRITFHTAVLFGVCMAAASAAVASCDNTTGNDTTSTASSNTSSSNSASTGSTSTSSSGTGGNAGMDGPPGNDVNKHPHETGNAANGKAVFRMETFGNEAFFTDAVKLPQGIVAAGLTPLQALKAGYSINVDALDAQTKAVVATELMTDLSPQNAPTLNNPMTTVALINANAVIGVVTKDSNGDGKLDVLAGDKVGVACAFCHATTDASVYGSVNGGSIGKEVDGPTPHNLNVGATFAIAANSRALYPIAQLSLAANGGATIGRAPTGLTEDSTEAEVDAYFNNPAYYPIGMFDDQPDGTGAPMHITPMFRSDLSAPYGSEGAISKLDNFSNLVYTVLFDLRNLNTAGGRAFLHKLGKAAGDEIVDDYVKILQATGVPLEPSIQVASTGMPGDERTPIGIRVDETKLLDLSGYMDSLQAPKGEVVGADMIAAGRDMFRKTCTSCHNVDQGHFVPSMIVPMAVIFPGDNPVNLGERDRPLSPLLNTVNSIFDDKMVVVNASLRGDIRGIALPLLLDLARKPVFLHDNTVPSLDALLDSARGPDAPHPFYLQGMQKTEMIAYLRSLDTSSK